MALEGNFLHSFTVALFTGAVLVLCISLGKYMDLTPGQLEA